jgi:hypothetical protein
MKRLTGILLLLVVFSANSFAQGSVVTCAGIVLVNPVAVSKTHDMSFGTITATGKKGGAIVLDGREACTSGGVTLNKERNKPTAAHLMVEVERDCIYSVTLPASVTVTNGTSNMVVRSVKTNHAASASGSQNFIVSAVLDVAAKQPAGNYSSEIAFTVNYN